MAREKNNFFKVNWLFLVLFFVQRSRNVMSRKEIKRKSSRVKVFWLAYVSLFSPRKKESAIDKEKERRVEGNIKEQFKEFLKRQHQFFG